MGTYYAAVEAFDPEGQALMEDDGIYGGEARFFVLEADDLFEALSTLSNSITVNGLRLTRILHAGAVEDFDDEMLPFEVDIDEMVEVAQNWAKSASRTHMSLNPTRPKAPPPASSPSASMPLIPIGRMRMKTVTPGITNLW